MRSQLRMRHYCDHCTKSMGSKPAMVKHESRCTANPDRVCTMCQLAGHVQRPMAELQAAFDNGFKALVEAANDCPACILAARRQYFSTLDADDWISFDDKRSGHEWDFKAACKAFWANYNEQHRSDPFDL